MRCPAAILEALRLYASGAWNSLEALAATAGAAPEASGDADGAGDPDRLVRALLLQAIARSPLQPCRPADLDDLAALAPEAACWVAMARSHVSIALQRLLSRDTSAALRDLRAGLNAWLTALTCLEFNLSDAEREQVLAGSTSLLHSLSSQQELQIAIQASTLPRQLIFILGMHRSGTSALSGMLVKAGFAAPRDLMPATEANPLGYWESLTLMQINDRLLQRIGRHWSSVEPLPDGWQAGSEAAAWRTELLNRLGAIFAERPDAVIKDPRFCLLMPALEPWLQTSLLRIVFLLPLRHPMEVALSLQKSEQTPIVQGLQLWLSHTLAAEEASRSHRRLLVDFQQLLQQPATIFEHCLALLGEAAGAGAGAGAGARDTAARATAFIDPQLHRQRLNTAMDQAPDPAPADDAAGGAGAAPRSGRGPTSGDGDTAVATTNSDGTARPDAAPVLIGTDTLWYALAERVHAVLCDPQLTPAARTERLEPLRRQWRSLVS